MKFLLYFFLFSVFLINQSFSKIFTAKILAKVGSKIITNFDVEQRLKLDAFINGFEYSKNFYEKFSKKILNDLITESTYLELAEENSMKIDEKIIVEKAEFFFKFKEKKNSEKFDSLGIRVNTLLKFVKSKIITSSIDASIAREFDVRLSEKTIGKIIDEKKQLSNNLHYGVLEVNFFNDQKKINEACEFLKKLKEEKNLDERRGKFIKYFISKNGTDCNFEIGLKWIKDNSNNYGAYIKNLNIGDFTDFIKVLNTNKLFMLVDKKGGKNVSLSELEVSILFTIIPVGTGGINSLNEEKISQINKIMLACFSVQQMKEIAKNYNLKTKIVKRQAIDLPHEIRNLNVNEKFGPSFDGENILIGIIHKKNINRNYLKKENIVEEYQNRIKLNEVKKIINKKRKMTYIETFI